MTISYGGPAFPFAVSMENHDGTKCTAYEAGMTLRDYFAAKSLPGIASTLDMADSRNHSSCAYIAYLMADAMLKQRTKT